MLRKFTGGGWFKSKHQPEMGAIQGTMARTVEEIRRQQMLKV